MDDQWHVALSPYLWLAGVHGSVGVLGRDAAVHASPADLLSNFRFGIMATVDARHNHIVTPVDIIWIRLGDDKSLPFPNIPATSANVKLDEVILTPKLGGRVVDTPKFKVDALAGVRYWHVAQNLSFSPSQLGLNFSNTLNWVDPLVGGRIETELSPKATLIVFGDVGGWGAGSQLEYQFGGALGFSLSRKWKLQAGYRYLDVDYTNGGNLLDVTMSGAVIGATYTFK
ncbi:MAG: hypothetical protein WBF42_04020 [Terracidiphilus sp.]